MGIIYKIKVNDRYYYGSSKQKYLSSRQARHNYNLRNEPNQLLYKECIKYNIDKIICEIVEVCENDKLNEKENFYILNDTNSLNMKITGCNEEMRKERKKESNKRYMQTENGKICKMMCDYRYNKKKSNL